MPRIGNGRAVCKSLRGNRLPAAGQLPGREAERAPCNVQRRPLACNAAVGYFLPARERFTAAA
jgi:hypothetical protein